MLMKIDVSHRHIRVLLCLLFCAAVYPSIPATAQSSRLILPTANHELLVGNDSLFYQLTTTNRDHPWEGGCYGFVRNPRHIGKSTVFTRFHEGIDIRPLHRDSRGRPLDSVMAIADGRVVHVSTEAGASNYGRYIVIEHVWNGSPYYSLYAHLNEIWVDEGTHVDQGTPIGRLGYTGVGINRRRAHLHLEVAMLLNGNFQRWYEPLWPNDSNEHGIYNGMNLVGVNVAKLYLALAENPNLTLPEFLSHEQVYYKVLLPRTGRLDLLSRYPWLQTSSGSPDDASWLVCFNRSGVPLRVETSTTEVKEPTVQEVRPSKIDYRYLTKGRIRGKGNSYTLSSSGVRYMDLVATGDEPTSEQADAGEREESAGTH